MTTHSSILTWRIPQTEEPGRLYSPWGCKSQTRLSDKTTPLPGMLKSIIAGSLGSPIFSF